MLSLIEGADRSVMFRNVQRSIRPPEKKNTVFAAPFPGQKLSLAIIEPRNDEMLQYALYNMAHVYGNSDVSLYVFHGTDNIEYVNNIIRNWTNVQLINLNISNLPYPGGPNDMLLSPGFYKTFKSEFVLSFQTDCILKRKIDDLYFNYEYVGGPWHESIVKLNGKLSSIHITPDRRVGNGGFSLRKISTMLQIPKLKRPEGWGEYWEDQLIVYHNFHY
jgi:hypothetical protein